MIFIPGTPAPKGSTKSFVVAGRARTTNANAATKPWQTHVSACVQSIIGPDILYPRPHAIELTMMFRMPRTASEPKRSTRPHTRKPDLDKLLRCVLDALSGLVYEDDAQVVSVDVAKGTAGTGEQPGLAISWREA